MARASSVEVADIFRQYGSSYRERHKMPLSQLRSMRAIERCRSAELGGHVDECDSCGRIRISYNSCRNRHCPKCQFLKKERWLEQRREDILPVPHFHVVFTIPAKLNPLALRNKSVFYNILFRSVAETLIELARDPKHLGGEIGFISILHTWGENLMDHPHIHCIVTGGGLSLDGKRWLSCRKTFFISVKVLSRLFRGKVLDYLRESWEQEQLEFQGTIADLQDPAQFSAFLKSLYCREWVVYSKPPFKDPEMLLDYLGRYTHRIAIGNHRILKMQNDEVFFLWRDYADGNKNKTMTVEASEFIRRFLLHVLPERFVKIRYYGLLANRNSKTMLAQCRKLLGAVTEKADAKNMRGTWQEFLLKVCGIDLRQCPFCQEGRMIRKEIVLPVRCNSPPWEKRTW
jgi:hypothetical protein